MPELVLLAVVSLTAMGMLIFLFLHLTKQQTDLIGLLTQTNQSLLNQVRTTELASLAGLNQMTGQTTVEEDVYMSTDQREMNAWLAQQSYIQQHGVGDEVYDEDLEMLRSNT